MVPTAHSPHFLFSAATYHRFSAAAERRRDKIVRCGGFLTANKYVTWWRGEAPASPSPNTAPYW